MTLPVDAFIVLASAFEILVVAFKVYFLQD